MSAGRKGPTGIAKARKPGWQVKPTASAKALRDQIRYPPKLKAKAAELGLPVCDYDESLAMAIRHMDGGRQGFLRFVSLAAADDDDDAKKFLSAFHELRPHEQQRVSFDLLCVASGVSPVGLLKTVVGVAFEAHVDTANLIAAAAHPQIVEAAVRSAKRVNSDIGQRDRQTLLQHHGFTPTPKGNTINIGVQANASAAAAAVTNADASVPSFLADANAAALPRETVQRQLTEGGVDLTPTRARDAELVEAD